MLKNLFTRLLHPDPEPAGDGPAAVADPPAPSKAAPAAEPGKAPAPPAPSPGSKLPDTKKDWEGPNPFLGDNPPADDDPGEVDLTGVDLGEEEPVDDGKPVAPEPPKPSRKTLRGSLEEAQVKLSALEAEKQAIADEKARLEESLEEARKNLKEREENYAKAKVIGPYNPAEDKEVVEIDQRLVRSLNAAKAEFDDPQNGALFQGSVTTLLPAYIAHIDQGKPLAGFREKLEEDFGEDAPRVLGAIKEMAEPFRQRMETVERNAASHVENVEKRYQEVARKVEGKFSKLGALSDSEIAEHPNSVDALLTQIAKKNEKFATKLEQIRRDGARIEAGLPPLRPGATAEEIAEYRTKERMLSGARENSVYGMMQNAAISEVFRQVYRELETLRERVAGKTKGNRPESSYEPGDDPKPPAAGDIGDGRLPDGANYEDAPNPFLQSR